MRSRLAAFGMVAVLIDAAFVRRSIVADVPSLTADKRLARAAENLTEVRVLDGV